MEALDVEIGKLTELATTPLCTIARFEHHADRRHRDPDVEVFDATRVVVTVAGRWRIATPGGRVDVHRGVLVGGDRDADYACRHDDDRPSDITLDVVFDQSALARALAIEPALVDDRGRLFPRRATVPAAEAHAIVDALIAELAVDRPGRALAVDGLASALLAHATRAPRRRVQCSDPAHAAADYMREHLADDLDLATLSRVAHVSPWHLTRLFGAAFGLPPRQYLLRLRVRRAAQLLEDTDLPVAAIAVHVGFHNLGHFRSSFRRFLGSSPSRWRAGRRR